jgi:transcriptional regulator with PAS, ATPase and Fis domain
MDSQDTLKTELFETVIQSIGGYKLTPLVLEMIKFLLKGIYEGLILVDKDGRIEFMDINTEKFFTLHPGEGVRLHVTDLMPDTNLHIVAKSGIPAIGQIQETKGERRIVSRLPIKKGGEIVGAIGKVLFHKLEEIEKLNNRIENLKLEINYYKKGATDATRAHYSFENLLGNSRAFLDTKEIGMRVAMTDTKVLIEGESGTGKELFAHSIHNLSRRKNGPFIRVNCPSIPFELAESELFGYEKGAFTGARNEGKPGKFELSEGGTIFLDEVGSLPLTIQAKLLRVLQEKEIERLGGKRTIKVDFRTIAATNASLDKLLETGHFRQDLLYRLNTVLIKIPPLRERKEDIPIYVQHFLREINRSLLAGVYDISDEALGILMGYSWPGNVRELANVLEQSVLSVSRGHVILPENLPQFIFETDYHRSEDMWDFRLNKILKKTEKETIERALNFASGNKRKVAKLMGIQRSSLYQKLKKHRIGY